MIGHNYVTSLLELSLWKNKLLFNIELLLPRQFPLAISLQKEFTTWRACVFWQNSHFDFCSSPLSDAGNRRTFREHPGIPAHLEKQATVWTETVHTTVDFCSGFACFLSAFLRGLDNLCFLPILWEAKTLSVLTLYICRSLYIQYVTTIISSQ